MGKKNKKEKKGKGKEKTEQKSEKKAEKRSKKELAEKGEEDIEKLIADFQEQDKRKVQVIEEKCGPPSPRCNESIVPHPERDELLMFGGEYFTGNKMYMYNDLFAYQIKKNEWVKVSVPNAPPPRSAHQAVVVSHQGGQMWIFGGEFSSHTQNQFYHYKDLWVLHLRDKKWEQIKAPGGPTARSGHRMVALKKEIIVFGGFHDNSREYKYYNDVYSFDIDSYTWTLLKPSGTGPCPRSGCILLPVHDAGKVMVYGGYSKVRVKKDVDKGATHTDMFALVQEKIREGSSDLTPKWKWQPVKQGTHPSPRSGMTGIVTPGNKAFLFGGVFDQEDDDEDLEGIFYNELWSLDLDRGKWFPVDLRGKRQVDGDKKKRRRKKIEGAAENEADNDEGDEDEGEEDEEMEITQEGVENLEIEADPEETVSDGVFTVTVAKQRAAPGNSGEGAEACSMELDHFWPSQRMNTALAVKDGTLFLYGGIFEEGDKQLTLADFYALDVHKLDGWSVIIAENRQLQEWQDSDSSDDEDKKEKKNASKSKTEDSEDESDDDSDQSMEITFDDAPSRRDGEGILDYFGRSQDYWVQKAREIYEEEGETQINERKLLRFAKDICEEACGS